MRRTRVCLLAVSLLLAGSCAANGGAGDDGPASYGAGGGLDRPSTTTSVPAVRGGGDARSPDRTSTTARDPGGATDTTRRDAPTGTVPSTQGGGVDDSGAKGPPGAFARTLLRPQPATVIVLERLQQSGAASRQSAIDHVAGLLRSASAKRVSEAEVVALDGGARSWSAAELRTLADESTKAGQGDGRAVLHLLFVRGTFNGSTDVLGVVVRGDVVAIFSDSVDAAETPVVAGASIEKAVLAHEVGHALGLVDLVRQTGRADPEHPGHSKNEKSVMYWAVESSLVATVLRGGPPTDFDDDDRADLAALRNGA